MGPAPQLQAALSGFAVVHFLRWRWRIDAATLEARLEEMARQEPDLPAFAFLPDVYRAHAAELLERWRSQHQ